MNDLHYYEVNLLWDFETRGTLSCPVTPDKIEVATGPGFPKGMKEKWTAEHLFVASVSSCMMSTFLLVADDSNSFSTPFCKPFPDPKRIISIKIPHATLKPVRKVLSLFFLMVLKISCHLSVSNILVVPGLKFQVSGYWHLEICFYLLLC